MKPITVLSLFDGMSCGQIALERAGIPVNTYYASEIDKYAITVAQANYPNTVQLGDVTKWREWDLPYIDLVLAGSPCQGFSFAGKQLAFDDPRSKLFFDFVDIKNHYKPDNFLLENVRMKQEFRDAISRLCGVSPVRINSALVSAQNRVRDYWTDIDGVCQPEDEGLFLKNILEGGIVDRGKSLCIDANYFKGGNLKQYFKKHRRQLVFSKVGRVIGRKINPETGKRDDYNSDLKRARRIEPRPDDKSGTLTTVPTDNVVVEICRATVQKNSEHNKDGKSTALTAAMGMGGGNVPMLMSSEDAESFKGKYLDGTIRHKWRKLTPVECERLQTVPDNYTNHVSNTQRYKMLGNGWTVDVIVHILKGLL